MLLKEFDFDKVAIINPDMVVDKLEDFPEVPISCFSKKLFDNVPVSCWRADLFGSL